MQRPAGRLPPSHDEIPETTICREPKVCHLHYTTKSIVLCGDTRDIAVAKKRDDEALSRRSSCEVVAYVCPSSRRKDTRLDM